MSSKKILLVCDFYYPNATSIGVCTHKVAKALQYHSNEVQVLTFGDCKDGNQGEYDGVNYFCIKKRFHERCIDLGKKTGGVTGRLIINIGKLKCRLWQLLWFPFFRMDSLIVPLRYYWAISKLHVRNNYDMIVATYNPFEGMLASKWFKKRHTNVFLCLYILDTLTDIGKTRFISEKLNDKMGWRWEKKIFPWCDQIINLRCHEEHHAQERYDLFRSKMVYSDIPLLEENNNIGGYFDSEHTHFVYTGRLLKTRSSAYLLSLIEVVSATKPYVLHFFSSGDEEDLIKHYEKKTSYKIIGHGIIPHSQISLILKSADVLVSISNSASEKITSKIFEYISTGNRIVHFQKDDSDPAINYYQKYSNVLVLNENDSQEKSINALVSFLKAPNMKIEFNVLEKSFVENLPSYTADLIMGSLMKAD